MKRGRFGRYREKINAYRALVGKNRRKDIVCKVLA
jgi:hypothetical protein